MNLPYDYARCAGGTYEECKTCRRREPGHPERQSYMAPPLDMPSGKCWALIEPEKKGKQ